MRKVSYGFDRSPLVSLDMNIPRMGVHCFEVVGGELTHEIDGVLRATVPPEGWADYVEAWPDAADALPVQNTLKNAIESAPPKPPKIKSES